MAVPRVFVVLLNWNNYEDTRECIDSLSETTYDNLHIILLDNGSDDGSGEQLREYLETADVSGQFIQNGANVGFSRGCNPGIQAALDQDADYVLLLNSDSVVDEGFLEPLVERAEANENVGSLTGKTYYYDDPERIHSAGAELDWIRGRGNHFGRGEIDTGQYDDPKEIGFTPGFFCFIRASVFEDIGLLSEQYFLGAEEWDFSARLQRSSWELWYEPESMAWHKVGGSREEDLDLKYVYNGYRNKLIYMDKFMSNKKYHLWFAVFWVYAHTVGLYQFVQDYSETDTTAVDILQTIRAAFIKNRHSQVVSAEEVINFSVSDD